MYAIEPGQDKSEITVIMKNQDSNTEPPHVGKIAESN